MSLNIWAGKCGPGGAGQMVPVQYAHSEPEKDRVCVFLGAGKPGGTTGDP